MKKSSTALNTFHQPRKLNLTKPRIVKYVEPEDSIEASRTEIEIARTVARHYLCFKKPFKTDKANVIPLRNLENSRYFKIFIDVAKNIIEHEKTSLIKTNILYYVLAHFCAYGSETYPGRLKASNSFQIYKSFREQASFKVCKSNGKNSQKEQEDMLSYLSDIRDETPVKTLKSLAKSGLFTDQFIMEKLSAG